MSLKKGRMIASASGSSETSKKHRFLSPSRFENKGGCLTSYGSSYKPNKGPLSANDLFSHYRLGDRGAMIRGNLGDTSRWGCITVITLNALLTGTPVSLRWRDLPDPLCRFQLDILISLSDPSNQRKTNLWTTAALRLRKFSCQLQKKKI